jgi:hypothetical protein
MAARPARTAPTASCRSWHRHIPAPEPQACHRAHGPCFQWWEPWQWRELHVLESREVAVLADRCRGVLGDRQVKREREHETHLDRRRVDPWTGSLRSCWWRVRTEVGLLPSKPRRSRSATCEPLQSVDKTHTISVGRRTSTYWCAAPQLCSHAGPRAERVSGDRRARGARAGSHGPTVPEACRPG